MDFSYSLGGGLASEGHNWSTEKSPGHTQTTLQRCAAGYFNIRRDSIFTSQRAPGEGQTGPGCITARNLGPLGEVLGES